MRQAPRPVPHTGSVQPLLIPSLRPPRQASTLSNASWQVSIAHLLALSSVILLIKINVTFLLIPQTTGVHEQRAGQCPFLQAEGHGAVLQQAGAGAHRLLLDSCFYANQSLTAPLAQGSIVTSFLRIGERTEYILPGATGVAVRPHGAQSNITPVLNGRARPSADGIVGTGKSFWDGDVHVRAPLSPKSIAAMRLTHNPIRLMLTALRCANLACHPLRTPP